MSNKDYLMSRCGATVSVVVYIGFIEAETQAEESEYSPGGMIIFKVLIKCFVLGTSVLIERSQGSREG